MWIAVAESVTAGRAATELARAAGASVWFCGGVAAYQDEVKHSILGVPPGPVITAECAVAMATGVWDLLGADLGVGVTGVGGPEPVEGQPPGTVFIAVAGAEGHTRTYSHRFDGSAEHVVQAAVERALAHLHGELNR